MFRVCGLGLETWKVSLLCSTQAAEELGIIPDFLRVMPAVKVSVRSAAKQRQERSWRDLVRLGLLI